MIVHRKNNNSAVYLFLQKHSLIRILFLSPMQYNNENLGIDFLAKNCSLQGFLTWTLYKFNFVSPFPEQEISRGLISSIGPSFVKKNLNICYNFAIPVFIKQFNLYCFLQHIHCDVNFLRSRPHLPEFWPILLTSFLFWQSIQGQHKCSTETPIWISYFFLSQIMF